MDIFPGHVTFDNLFKQSDWLLRLPLVCYDYFRVSLLLSHKKILTFFHVLFMRILTLTRTGWIWVTDLIFL